MRKGLRTIVQAARPKTMDEALRIAEEQERYNEMLGDFGQIHVNTASPEDTQINLPSQSAVETASRQLTEINNRPYPQNRSREINDRDCPENRKTNLRCHFCGRTGHFQRECRTRQRYLERQTQSTQNRPSHDPPVQRRMSRVQSSDAGPSRFNSPRDRAPGPSTGRQKFSFATNHKPAIKTDMSKNGARQGPARRAPTLPRPFTKPNKYTRFQNPQD